MGEVDLLGFVIEDRRLYRPVEEVFGVPREELVQRILAGDVAREPAAAATGASPHLAQARDRAREGDHEGGVQSPDVDAELERVGGDDSTHLAGHQTRLDLAPLRRCVAAPIRRHQLSELAGAEALELVAGDPAQQLHSLAGSHEADRSRPGDDQPGQQLGALGERGAPRAQHLVGHRRVPDRDPPAGRRGAVVVDQRHLFQAGQALS